MKFARRVFLVAGIYGLLIMLPQYLLETKNGIDYPPAITHPEYYYGFIGVTVAWQLAFLFIARDPLKLRPLMIPAVIEKAAFIIPVSILYVLGRVALPLLVVGAIDGSLGVLFAIAYLKTRPS